MSHIVLKNWGVVDGRDEESSRYQPPEFSTPCLDGNVYGHPNPRFHDGKRITTSSMVSAQGRLVTCASRTYELVGPPSPEYLAWCNANGTAIDQDNPIGKVRS